MSRIANWVRSRIRSAGLALAQIGGAAMRKGIRAWRAPVLPIRTQWFLQDIAQAMREADGGLLRTAAQLAEAFSIDGRIQGILSTRVDGLFSLPRGVLSSGEPTPLARWAEEDFFSFWPRTEAAFFVRDLVKMGCAIAEICEGEDVRGRPTLRVVRLPPEHLTIVPATGEVYYLGEPVTPGDGRWILWKQTEIAPWRAGIWPALARAFIAKDHAYFLRENYSNTLANPARVAQVPEGDSDEDADEWIRQVASWGPDTVFATRPGHTLEIVESNGQGYQVFRATMEDADKDATFAVAGQVVTSEGASGFVNMEIFNKIRSDLIDGDGQGFAHVVNTQALPWWQEHEAATEEEAAERLCFAIDTEDPAKRAARIKTYSDGIDAAKKAKDAGYITADIEKLAGIHVAETAVVSSLSFFAYDLDVGYVTLNEARSAKGLPPLADARGTMLLLDIPKAGDPLPPETPAPAAPVRTLPEVTP